MYEFAKVLHIISFVAWFAGLFYLPRLFVYHCKFKKKDKSYDSFSTMENKLYKIIMNPAMILTILSGATLIHEIGFNGGWLHAKLTLIILLIGFHHVLGSNIKKFANSNNQKSEKYFRIINEVPTVLLVLIVILVIYKPF
jgi:protoporphyrinogen IX oxidase